MSKLAIIFLAAVAFQAASAGVPRFYGNENMMSIWNVEKMESKEMMMHLEMFFENFCHHLEYKVMDKETILCCIRNFVRFMDVLCEKFECKTCTDKIFLDCLMVCKNIKMECEKMLMSSDFHFMKMEFVRCIRMFHMEFRKWCMHEEFCVSFMHEDIFAHLRTMFHECESMGFVGSMSGHFEMHKNLFRHFETICRRFIHYCETTDMTKDMIMTCVHDFMRIIDYTCEKLCFGDKCNNVMMGEICMELKNLKMMLERCLSYETFTDLHKMKLECCECVKIFMTCMEKWMMCDNCCVGFEMLFHDICMHFIEFCEMMCGKMGMGMEMGMDWYMTKDLTNKYHGHHLYKDLTMRVHFMFKKFMEFCEHTDMTKDMMIVCIRKFMTVLDYTMEKLCVEGKCNNMMIHEICTEFRRIKMVLERCISYDFHQMKMKCLDCYRMYFRCIERLMMCDNCCDGFEMLFHDICMHFIGFCEMMCGKMGMGMEMGMDCYMTKDLTNMYHGHHLYKDLTMRVHFMFKKFMEFCEHTDMTKDMMMVCIRKFMTVLDYTMEKLCVEGKCNNMMIHEICTEFRRIKMVLERCINYDFHQMKMECLDCCRMYFKCIERLMMCDNCCVGFEMIYKDICTYFIHFCETMCSTMNRFMTYDVPSMYHSNFLLHKDFPMHIHMLVKRLIEYCETGKVSKETLMTCMRKFVVIVDYTIEKLCMGDKCDDSKVGVICMELKNCKMMIERCLSYGMFTDFHRMKMECCECIKMFFRCMEKLMMCDNCCVGFEMIWSDICMRFETLCNFVFYRSTMTPWPMMKDFTTMYRDVDSKYMMPYVFHHYMKY